MLKAYRGICQWEPFVRSLLQDLADVCLPDLVDELYASRLLDIKEYRSLLSTHHFEQLLIKILPQKGRETCKAILAKLARKEELRFIATQLEDRIDSEWMQVSQRFLLDLANVWRPRLDRLYVWNLLSNEEYELLRTLPRIEQCNMLLSQILPSKGPGSYDTFLNLLSNVEEFAVVEMLREERQRYAAKSEASQETGRDLVRYKDTDSRWLLIREPRLFSKVVGAWNCHSRVLGSLQEMGIISSAEYESLLSDREEAQEKTDQGLIGSEDLDIKSRESECRKLLIDILPKKGLSSFDFFLRVLKYHDEYDVWATLHSVSSPASHANLPRSAEVATPTVKASECSQPKTSKLSQESPYSSTEEVEVSSLPLEETDHDLDCSSDSDSLPDPDRYIYFPSTDPRWDLVVRPLLPTLVDTWVPDLDKLFSRDFITMQNYDFLCSRSRFEQCRTTLVEFLPNIRRKRTYDRFLAMLKNQKGVPKIIVQMLDRHLEEFVTSRLHLSGLKIQTAIQRKMNLNLTLLVMNDRNPQWENVKSLLSDLVWIPSLDHLYASRLLTIDEYKLLRCLPHQQQVKTLLIKILPFEETRYYKRLLKFLLESEEHESVLVKTFKKLCEEEQIDKRWLLIREPLFSKVVAAWNFSGHKSLLTALWEEGLISSEELFSLLRDTLERGVHAGNLKLLFDTLKKNNFSSFDEFLVVLKDHNLHAWKILNSAVFEAAYYISQTEEKADASASTTPAAAKDSLLQGEQLSSSLVLRWRYMTLMFTRTQTVVEDVDESGSRIEGDCFSITIPPGAVKDGAVRLGFTIYEYQPKASAGLKDEDDCIITDILVVHAYGTRFAKNVTISFDTTCNLSESATLLYEAQDTGFFYPFPVKASQSTVSDEEEMTLKLHLSSLDIHTKHFCKSVFACLGCVEHCYRTLAFGRWAKGESSRRIETAATIDLHFTSSKPNYADVVERCNRGMSVLLNSRASIYFPKRGRFTLAVNKISYGWELQSSPSVPIEKEELHRAEKHSSEFCTRSFTFKRTRKDAEELWLEVRLTDEEKTDCILILSEDASRRALPEQEKDAHGKSVLESLQTTSTPAFDAAVAKASLVQCELPETTSSSGIQESRSLSLSSIESNRKVELKAPVASNTLNKDGNRCYTADSDSVLLDPHTENGVLIVNGERVICIKKATASDRMDREGGSLALPSYGISLTIPPGAITTTTLLGVTLSLFVSDKAINLQGTTAYVGLIELLPHRTAFTKPVTLSYNLRHHYKPGNDSIETEYGFFYGEGIDPGETYDFIGSLGLQNRHLSYKGTMDISLRDECLELSTKTFCRFCPIVTVGSFKVAICFFVRPRSVYNGEQRWDIRITLSCTCPSNLKEIEEKLMAGKFRRVDEKRLRCKKVSYNSNQRVEFSLSNDDDFTSKNFKLRSKREFSGEDLRCVVENNDRFPDYLDKDCAIKCSEEADCSQPLTLVYRYYESLPPFFREDLVSEDEVSVVLQEETSFDYGSSDSDVFSNGSSVLSQRTKSSRGVDESYSSKDASSEAESPADKDNIFDFNVQACESSLAHTNDQRNETEWVYPERKPTIRELQNVADRIVRDWTHVARRLGVDEKNIQIIETNEKWDARERSVQMLLHWKESKHDSSTVECLCKALLEEHKKETVGDVFKVVSN